MVASAGAVKPKVNKTKRGVKLNSVGLDRLPRKPVSETIRERVAALYKAKPELTQETFGDAIGRTGQWVSMFLSGQRSANDVRLVVRIARFFGVPPSYLLDEPTAEGSLVPEISAVCEGLSKEQQEVVLRVARSLPPPSKGTPPTR
jgi:transcriptional regulator with XRE-family HTH domain